MAVYLISALLIMMVLVVVIPFERHLKVYNVDDVLKYNSNELVINSVAKIKREEVFIDLEGFNIYIGCDITLLIDGDVVEEKIIRYPLFSYDDKTVKFRGPWKKDVNEVLKIKYKKYKRCIKEVKKTNKIMDDKERELSKRNYQAAKK